MSKALPKTLDIGMGCMGGYPHLYARNVMRSGDFANIAFVVGDIKAGDEIYLEMYSEFNTPAYRQQAKDFLRNINPQAVFNDDQNTTSIAAEKVIEVAQQQHGLMNYEVDIIKKNPAKLHELYLVAKAKKHNTLPSQYDYEAMHGQYPLYQVFGSLTKILHG